MKSTARSIDYFQGKVIKVPSNEFKSILGHLSSHCTFWGHLNIKVGDQIKIIEYNSADSILTGLFCYRWVVDITERFALLGDDDTAILWLSPIKCESEPLGLSGVQNRDNLESF